MYLLCSRQAAIFSVCSHFYTIIIVTKIKKVLKGERKNFLKNYYLTSYAIIFGHRTFISIMRLVF